MSKARSLFAVDRRDESESEMSVVSDPIVMCVFGKSRIEIF